MNNSNNFVTVLVSKNDTVIAKEILNINQAVSGKEIKLCSTSDSMMLVSRDNVLLSQVMLIDGQLPHDISTQLVQNISWNLEEKLFSIDM